MFIRCYRSVVRQLPRKQPTLLSSALSAKDEHTTPTSTLAQRESRLEIRRSVTAVTRHHRSRRYRPIRSERLALDAEWGRSMSLILPSYGIRHAETRTPETAEDKPAAETVSPAMLVFSWIWTGLITYFAVQAALH